MFSYIKESLCDVSIPDDVIVMPVPGIVGCLQALEAIKIASGIGEPLIKRMLILDAYSTNIRVVWTLNITSCMWITNKVLRGEWPQLF